MFWMKLMGTFFKVLKDGATPNQIAAGFTMGFAMGMIPGWPLQVIALGLLVLLFNVNLSMAGVGMAVAVAVSWLFDPLLDGLGGWVLGIPDLHGVYTFFYNNTLLMLTRFNNTVVMGGMLAMLLAAVPLFFASRVGVLAFRERLLPALSRLKIVQVVRTSRFYGWYEKVNQYRFW